MENCNHKYCARKQQELLPKEHEDESIYFKRIQEIKDAWLTETVDYLAKEIWFVPSESIEHHATKVSLDDQMATKQHVSDLLDFLIEVDEMETTVMMEALKHGKRREL